MKKKIGIIFVILLLLVSILGTFCYASQIQPRTSTEEGINPISDVAPNENQQAPTTGGYDIVYNDLYVVEQQNYEMDKIVDGNVFIFVNGNVRFTGEVNGSVFILANGTVEFTKEAYVADAIYILAEEIKIDAKIYDVYAVASQKFEMTQNAYIARDIRVTAQDVSLRGLVYRDAYISGENIDVKDDTTSLSLGGDFNYTSNSEINQLEDVVLHGEINFKLDKEITQEGSSLLEKIKDYAFGAITSIIYVLAIYFILILIAPKFVGRVGKDLKEKPILGFLVGLVSWIVAIMAFIISFILLFTSFASPITIIAWLLMTTIIYISSAVFSISVLHFVKDKITSIKDNKSSEFLALIVIALCVWILQKLPFVGGILSFVIVTTGVGLIIRNIIAKKDINDVMKTEET